MSSYSRQEVRHPPVLFQRNRTDLLQSLQTCDSGLEYVPVHQVDALITHVGRSSNVNLEGWGNMFCLTVTILYSNTVSTYLDQATRNELCK